MLYHPFAQGLYAVCYSMVSYACLNLEIPGESQVLHDLLHYNLPQIYASKKKIKTFLHSPYISSSLEVFVDSQDIHVEPHTSLYLQIINFICEIHCHTAGLIIQQISTFYLTFSGLSILYLVFGRRLSQFSMPKRLQISVSLICARFTPL